MPISASVVRRPSMASKLRFNLAICTVAANAGTAALTSQSMILLVEDDEDVREMLEFTLRSHGFLVEVANDGNAALEALARQRPCLVVLDLVMPVMTGWDVIAQMKARQLGDIPVCVISAFEGRTPSEAVASLCKPFDARELLALAARYCSHTSSPTRAAESAGSG